MPELPDITVYLECLAPRILGRRLEGIRLLSASLLRTVDPPLALAQGRTVTSLRRVGKRVVIGLDGEEDGERPGELFLVLHLMIAGRLRWRAAGSPLPARRCHAAFDFSTGCLLFSEASTRKRAMLHFVRGEEELRSHDAGGIEIDSASVADFERVLRSENHTLKRTLTDPRLLSGIGNAYSDEILHRARLSPVKLTSRLSAEEVQALFDATRSVLSEWTSRLRDEVGDGFPEKVTAFHKGMAVHGRYREPCPVCASPIQRIVKGQHETNYCPRCQTGGKLLADRALSKLLKKDWPRTLEELELRLETGAPPQKRQPRGRPRTPPESDSSTAVDTARENSPSGTRGIPRSKPRRGSS